MELELEAAKQRHRNACTRLRRAEELLAHVRSRPNATAGEHLSATRSAVIARIAEQHAFDAMCAAELAATVPVGGAA